MKISNNGNFASASVKSDTKKVQTKEVFNEELGKFEEKVREKLNYGEPAYNLGMTSITEQDWEDLMDNIDDYMEKAKELQAKQQEKMEQESMESRIYNKFYLKLHDKGNK